MKKIKKIKKNYNSKAFTLVELLVSVALFSIVMTVAISAILNIVDSNRKAQSLKSVMNNLNFSIESMTRTIKTGSGYSMVGTFCDATGGDGLRVEDVILTDDDGNIITIGGELPYVEYSLVEDANQKGRIQKEIQGGSTDYITAPEIDIETLCFYVEGEDADDEEQPKVIMIVQGVGIDPQKKTSTDFSLQTTVSQRLIDS